MFVGYRTIDFHRRSIAVDAKVIGNDSIFDEHLQQQRYFPLVTYTDREGRSHSRRLEMSSNTRWDLGKAMAVRYDIADPDHADSAGILEWLLPIAFLVPGVFFLIGGIARSFVR